MKDSPADRPRDAANDCIQGWRRIAGAYAIDLAVSLAVVLIGARLWGVVSTGVPDTTWGIHLHAAVDRFTPAGLWDIYRDATGAAIRDLGQQRGAGAMSNLLLGMRLLFGLLRAAPATLAVIWQQTDTFSDWLTLIGFGTVMAGIFLVLVTGRWLSFTRLLIAAVGSPLAAIGLFWMAEQSLLNMMDGLDWFAAVAPWCLLCPIACTLYWVAFPHAEHGATGAVLRAARRLRVAYQPRRPHQIAANAATVPLTRK